MDPEGGACWYVVRGFAHVVLLPLLLGVYGRVVASDKCVVDVCLGDVPVAAPPAVAHSCKGCLPGRAFGCKPCECEPLGQVLAAFAAGGAAVVGPCHVLVSGEDCGVVLL